MDANFGSTRRKVVWGSGTVAALLASSMLFWGCGDVVRQGNGSGMLVIDSLRGANGAEPGQMSNEVDSDVVTLVRSADGLVATIFQDPGSVSMRVIMKDSLTSPTTNNWVTITRYRVTYVRADGRNTPGVDVPYAFDGATTATITEAGTTFGFTLVRVQAKEEAPLLALRDHGGAAHISTIAQVTFYGTDRGGNAVSVTGNINVHFANWGDPG